MAHRPSRTRRLTTALFASVAVIATLVSCTVGPGAPHRPDPPDALDASPATASASEVAIYVAETYSYAVETGQAEALAFMDAVPCWYCSPESQVLMMVNSVGGGTDGGGFRKITVTGSTETSSTQISQRSYTVALDASRQAWTFYDVNGKVVGREPTKPVHLTVFLVHSGSRWSIEGFKVEELPA